MQLVDAPLLGIVPCFASTSTIFRRQLLAAHSSPTQQEAFRSIRTAVYHHCSREKVNLLQVTSALPNEGKSTIASNLAASMAQCGDRVLLVDADFRKPLKHKLYKAAPDNGGLAALLTDDQTTHQVIISSSVYAGLDILPCKPNTHNPAELLSGKHFSELLSDFSNCYDRIIVDSPSVLPLADAQIIAAACHMTILVVHQRICDHLGLLRAADILANLNIRTLGFVLNCAPPAWTYQYKKLQHYAKRTEFPSGFQLGCQQADSTNGQMNFKAGSHLDPDEGAFGGTVAT